MPVAIVMSLQDAVPAILMEDTAEALVSRLSSLVESPVLDGENAARLWLQGLPSPSGWFASPEEARAHVRRIHQDAPILPGKVVKAAREALGMGRAEFAAAIGYNGNDNTRHKTIFDIENEAMNKSSGRPRILNPNAVLRLQALLAERGLDLATE